ncbi:MAG: hypothetical protein RL095_2985 [Verrucomicrobiota bacterium]|jgi:chaperone BCS1
MQLIEQFVSKINSLSGGNQFIAGALGAWGLGVATYLARNVPEMCWDYARRHLSTEMSVNSSQEIFAALLEWIEKEGLSHSCRRVKFLDKRHCQQVDSDEIAGSVKTVGYGSHLLWYRGRLLLVELSRQQTQGYADKETISITKFGRSHQLFHDIMEQLATARTEEMTLCDVYNGSWGYAHRNPKRSFDSVCAEQELVDQIKSALDRFLSREEWYRDLGVPWQLGIMLHGPPGTGKTSLVKAIAAHLGRGIAYIPCARIGVLTEAVASLPRNSILVIEDIDAAPSTHARDDEDKEARPLVGSDIASILNALDGVMARHGRILVATTNHLEKLDPALLRPGRIDLCLEVGYVSGRTLESFIRRFFPDCPELPCLEPREACLSGAKVQNELLQCRSWQEAVARLGSPLQEKRTA